MNLKRASVFERAVSVLSSMGPPVVWRPILAVRITAYRYANQIDADKTVLRIESIARHTTPAHWTNGLARFDEWIDNTSDFHT